MQYVTPNEVFEDVLEQTVLTEEEREEMRERFGAAMLLFGVVLAQDLGVGEETAA